MKKILFLLLISGIMLFSEGCSSQAGSIKDSDNSSIIESPAEYDNEWPTKEWRISSPEEQDIDSDILAQADNRINENYPNIYSLLIVRNGYLVYEKYYNGMNRDYYNPVYSVTKSVMSALTGIALQQNLISDMDQKISDFLPEYFIDIDDTKKHQISIRNVLTMSGGLESIDNDYNSYFSSGDWLKYTINKPIANNPGEQFVYNTGLTHFLSGIITKASGMTTSDYAAENLFGPLGISVQRWQQDGTGLYGGGTGLYLTPIDMTKLGYLYLNNGLWDGEQIIPEEWVLESTTKQIEAYNNMDYGYLFFLQNMEDKVHGKSYFTYRADGAGGQKIVVVPELNLVAVITANINSNSIDGTDTQIIISDYVIPAVK